MGKVSVNWFNTASTSGSNVGGANNKWTEKLKRKKRKKKKKTMHKITVKSIEKP